MSRQRKPPPPDADDNGLWIECDDPHQAGLLLSIEEAVLRWWAVRHERGHTAAEVDLAVSRLDDLAGKLMEARL